MVVLLVLAGGVHVVGAVLFATVGAGAIWLDRPLGTVVLGLVGVGALAILGHIVAVLRRRT